MHIDRAEKDRESGFRGRRNRARHDVSIYYIYRPEKQWRTTIRFMSKTAAEARRRTMR